MAKVKIFLDKDETIEDAENQLQKALEFHSSGKAHVDDEFDDAAVEHTLEYMVKKHDEIYSDILDEIIQMLNEEY